MESEGEGELRLGMEACSPPEREPALDLSLEISLENEDLRNLGKYLGDLDLDSCVSPLVFSITLLEPRIISSMTSSDTLDKGWDVFLQ